MNTTGTPKHALTVDVEDWYQVSAFESVVDRRRWDTYESRVVANTTRLLSLFAKHDVRCTFFTLGWVAARHPDLIRAIHDQGHEVASHGYEHQLVYSLDAAAFREDLERAREALEAAAPLTIAGFRAPSFSITPDTLWAYDVMRALGYRYSSSVFPVRHDRYGIPNFPRHPVRLADDEGHTIYELPMTTWRVMGRNVPASGGGWMRLLPLGIVRRGLRQAEADGRPGMLYLHPWEIDPGQPRLTEASRKARFRHTVHLGKMEGRLVQMLREFDFGTVTQVLDGIETGAFDVACPVLSPQALAPVLHSR